MKNVFVKNSVGIGRSGSEKENVKHVYCHSLYSRELLRKVMKHFYTRQLAFHRARTVPRPPKLRLQHCQKYHTNFTLYCLYID